MDILVFLAIYALVMVTGEDNDVPARSLVHHRRARLLSDDILHSRETTRADATDDKDVH
jgi:hypothetical protein